MGNFYTVIFDNVVCLIRDQKLGQLLTKIHMTKNNIFPLEIRNVWSASCCSRYT